MLGLPGARCRAWRRQASILGEVLPRRREHTQPPSATTQGFAGGAGVDSTLRSEGKGSLDDVMRLLLARSDGGPVTEADIAAALAEGGGRSFAKELRAGVHGTDDPPWRALLAKAGVAWNQQPPGVAQRLGLRVMESALTGIKVSNVLRGGAAEAAGVSAGDELIGVAGWRLRRLDDLARLVRSGTARCWWHATALAHLGACALPSAAGRGAQYRDCRKEFQERRAAAGMVPPDTCSARRMWRAQAWCRRCGGEPLLADGWRATQRVDQAQAMPARIGWRMCANWNWPRRCPAWHAGGKARWRKPAAADSAPEPPEAAVRNWDGEVPRGRSRQLRGARPNCRAAERQWRRARAFRVDGVHPNALRAHGPLSR